MQMKNNEIFVAKKAYPKIDNFVVIYVGVVLFFQTLLQISPVVSFLATTPLYSIQTYLGLLGGGLILLDLFTTKRIWQGKYVVFLLAILAFAALATDRMMPDGLKENLFKLCWMAIQFCLVYSCVYRIPREELEDKLKTLFYGLLTIWTFACCVSFAQYVNQYGYQTVVNPLAKDTSANWQGFHDNRLYGIFYTLNHAAYVSLLFAIIAAGCAIAEKRIWVRLCLAAAQMILIIYIILSGSRSALISLFACAAIAGGLAIRCRLKSAGRWKIVLYGIVILLVIALCCAGYMGIKAGLSKIPSIMDSAETAENILDRTNGEQAASGRIKIWSEYISLYKEIGLTGLSPGNYMPYVLREHPELFIVYNAKHNYPNKYDAGIIYHVHSGYMMVYVSAGILGLLALVAFMALCLSALIRRLWKNRKMNIWYACSLLLVIAGAISAAFDEGLFFQNNPQTTIFWFALGLLLSDRWAETQGN